MDVLKRYYTWCGSASYKPSLESTFENIVKRSKLAENEAETSSIFERELYFLLRKELGCEMGIEREKPVNGGVKHKFSGLASRKSGRGRIDAVCNNLIIEYKHHSKLETVSDIEQAYAQVTDYLLALDGLEGVQYDAILTDGTRIAYFSFVDGNVNHTSLRMMKEEDVELIIKAILNSNTKKFTPKNIAFDFSVSAQVSSPAKGMAKVLFEQLTDHITGKSTMLYSEWKSLIHLSVDDNGKSADIEKRRRDISEIFDTTVSDADTEYKALFALHTTYAIIVKLIACKVLESNVGAFSVALADLPSEKMREFFQRMEDGLEYRNIGIRNFLEGDFFSWYADERQWSDGFWTKVKDIIRIIDDYSTFSIEVKYAPVDVFKDLYMSIIPQSVRHSMGEYFTPEWLADSVVEGALEEVNNDKWEAIDPCCGSGIFVMSLIRKIIGDVALTEIPSQERKRLLKEILCRVHGIDINPLSVLSTRVSYYLAVSKLGIVRDVEIPIFLGDSALVPTLEMIDGMACYSYTINNLRNEAIRVVLPQRLVEDQCFGQMMEDIQSMVNSENEDSIMNVFQAHLNEEERISLELITYLQTLSHNLVNLHKNHWDGIWVRIIMNYMMVARLKSFDMIVGNPPWVKWEHLPAAYTRRIKDFCDVRHIFCNDGGMFGGAQLNICALISNVTATNWLKPTGVLAFLMPDSIMSQNSYEEFRNFYINYEKKERLYLNKIDRWRAPLRPFKVGKKVVSQDFNTYYYSSQFTDYRKGIPVRVISKRKGVSDDVVNQCSTWETVKPLLVFSENTAKQLSDSSTAFTYVSSELDFDAIIGETAYHYRTGVESTPFEIFKLLGVGESTRGNQYYRFRNKQLKTSRYKVEDIPADGWAFPTRYIYPIVEGPSVKPFAYEVGNNYHIIPYKETDTANPVPLNELYLTDRELAMYFTNHKHLLDKQSEKSKSMHRGGEFYALSKIGPYTFAPHLVAARDNSNFCASVIKPTLTPWGEWKQSVCVKHTIIISQGVDGHFITEDEAHYISGVLNSSIVKAYIHSTFKTNGFSLKKSHLYLPQFIPDNKAQLEIARLSKEATLHADRREKIAEQLTQVYLKLCIEK